MCPRHTNAVLQTELRIRLLGRCAACAASAACMRRVRRTACMRGAACMQKHACVPLTIRDYRP